MPAAPSYGPFAPSFANPPPLSAFYGVDEDRGISRELEEAAKLGDSIGRALRAAVGLAVIVADVINEADQKPARVRRVRK